MSRHCIEGVTLGKRKVPGKIVVGFDRPTGSFFFIVYRDGEALSPTNQFYASEDMEHHLHAALKRFQCNFRGPLCRELHEELLADVRLPRGTNRVAFWRVGETKPYESKTW